jgi:hypothetical protein
MVCETTPNWFPSRWFGFALPQSIHWFHLNNFISHESPHLLFVAGGVFVFWVFFFFFAVLGIEPRALHVPYHWAPFPALLLVWTGTLHIFTTKFATVYWFVKDILSLDLEVPVFPCFVMTLWAPGYGHCRLRTYWAALVTGVSLFCSRDMTYLFI